MKDNRNEENFDNDFLIEMTDDEGNVFYYVEEMIIPIDGENFALLVEVNNENAFVHEHCEDCDCEDDVIIAKIVTGEDGQDEYIEPTDEEFAKVQEAYEKLMDENE